MQGIASLGGLRPSVRRRGHGSRARAGDGMEFLRCRACGRVSLGHGCMVGRCLVCKEDKLTSKEPVPPEGTGSGNQAVLSVFFCLHVYMS